VPNSASRRVADRAADESFPSVYRRSAAIQLVHLAPDRLHLVVRRRIADREAGEIGHEV
jgi:hypothetical protein